MITDHAALKYIMTAPDTSRKQARWALKIRGYDFDVKHRPESKNINADSLTRLECHEEGQGTAIHTRSAVLSTNTNMEKEVFTSFMLQQADELPDTLVDPVMA